MTCCWRCWMLTPSEGKGSPRPHTLSLAHWSRWSLETAWGMGHPSNCVRTWECEAFSELWEKTELLWWGCRSVTECEFSSLLGLHIGVSGEATGRSPLSVFLTLSQLHCYSAFSETLQKHLKKSSLRTALWDRELLPLLLRGRTERERWRDRLEMAEEACARAWRKRLVSVSQSKTLKHWLDNIFFQHRMVWNVEQHHLGQMFTSVSLGNACSAADLDKVPRYRQRKGAYSQICNGCKGLHLKVIWNSF